MLVFVLASVIGAAEREGMTSSDTRECWTAIRRLSRQMDAISMRPVPDWEMMGPSLFAI